jgi:hypothetical protein
MHVEEDDKIVAVVKLPSTESPEPAT